MYLLPFVMSKALKVSVISLEVSIKKKQLVVLAYLHKNLKVVSHVSFFRPIAPW